MSYTRSQKSGVPVDDVGERGDECRSAEERAKQNTGHKLEVKKQRFVKKISKDFDISQEETSVSFKKNLVLTRLAYSHQSLYYAYVIHWNATFSWMTVSGS